MKLKFIIPKNGLSQQQHLSGQQQQHLSLQQRQHLSRQQQSYLYISLIIINFIIILIKHAVKRLIKLIGIP